MRAEGAVWGEGTGCAGEAGGRWEEEGAGQERQKGRRAEGLSFERQGRVGRRKEERQRSRERQGEAAKNQIKQTQG